MGNVMTGRQAYGDYDSTASEKQSDHIDDPLAELARIVSEGDEYLRKQRLEAEAEGLLDTSGGYDQTVEPDNRTEPDAVADHQGYAPASYQPDSPEFHDGDAGQQPYAQVDYQEPDYREPDYQEADYEDSDSRIEDYRQPVSLDQNRFEQDLYQTDETDPQAYFEAEFAEDHPGDEAVAAEPSAAQYYEQPSYEGQTVQDPEYYDAPADDTGPEADQQPDVGASMPEFAPLPAVNDPYETVSNATEALTETRVAADDQAWEEPEASEYDDPPADYATADPHAAEMQPDLRDPYLNEADYQPAVEAVTEASDYSVDSAYYPTEMQGEPTEIHPTAEEPGVAPDIQLDPAALVGPADFAEPSYAENPDPVGHSSHVDAGYATEPQVRYEPQVEAPAENTVWPEEGDPYTIDPRENVAMQASAGAQTDVDSGDLSYGVGADGDLVETVPPIAGVSDPNAAAAEPASRNLGLKAMAAVVALSLLGGGGLFAYRTFGGAGAAGEPKVIKADSGPFKVEPDAPTQTGSANAPGSGVYQRLSGDGRTDKSQERIVVGKEEPVNVARNSDNAGAAEPRSTLPKPVKTIVVKPDGTFVSRPDPRAAQPSTTAGTPSQPTPSVTANQPDKAPKSVARVVTTTPIRTVTTDRTNGQAQESAASGTTPAAAVSQRAQSAAETIANANPTVVTSLAEAGRQGDPTVTGRAEEETAPPVTTITVVPRAKPPVPAQRTRAFAANDQAAAPAAETRAPAQAAPAQQSQPAAAQTRAAPTIPKGAYIVQVSSQRSRKQAQDAYSSLQRRFPSVLGDVQPVIQKADLGDRGTYYRVRLGPYQQQAAARLCSNLKSAGGDCFVRRN